MSEYFGTELMTLGPCYLATTLKQFGDDREVVP